jgi:hypothetical protein
MSLSTLLLGLYFILVGLSLLSIVAVSNTVLGVIALIVGILILVSAVHPIHIGGSKSTV